LKEWVFLVLCPIPIVLLDEIRKYISRQRDKTRKIKNGGE